MGSAIDPKRAKVVARAHEVVGAYFIELGRTAETYALLLDEACRCAARFLGETQASVLVTQAATRQLARQMITEATILAEPEGSGPVQ